MTCFLANVVVLVLAVLTSMLLLCQVCDASGCIDYTNPSRRVACTGVCVEYEIKADVAGVEAIESAVGSTSFATAFEESMAANGYEIEWLDKPPPITTPAPAPAEETVPEDTPHYVSLTVTMPYTKAEFDDSKKAKYKVCGCRCDVARVLVMPSQQMRVCPSCSRVRLTAVIRFLRVFYAAPCTPGCHGRNSGHIPQQR